MKSELKIELSVIWAVTASAIFINDTFYKIIIFIGTLLMMSAIISGVTFLDR